VDEQESRTLTTAAGCDIRDDEWNLAEPLIPPGMPAEAKRTVIMREVVNGLLCTFSRPAVSGARSRKTARSTTISIC
jgi:hypothetical protein